MQNCCFHYDNRMSLLNLSGFRCKWGWPSGLRRQTKLWFEKRAQVRILHLKKVFIIKQSLNFASSSPSFLVEKTKTHIVILSFWREKGGLLLFGPLLALVFSVVVVWVHLRISFFDISGLSAQNRQKTSRHWTNFTCGWHLWRHRDAMNLENVERSYYLLQKS